MLHQHTRNEMDDFIGRTILFSTLIFGLNACGDSGTTSEPQKPENTVPVISSSGSIIDSSNDNIIESAESFTLLLNISDSDGDTVSGKASLSGIEVTLDAYTADLDFSHQAHFSAPIAGDYNISVSVTDSQNAKSSATFDLSVIPNMDELIVDLQSNIAGFIEGGTFDDNELLGIAKDTNNSNIGYLEGSLTNKQTIHNSNPFGVCGATTPHKLLEVQRTSSGVIIPESKLVFPLECLSNSQSKSIKSKISTARSQAELSGSNVQQNYVAQHVAVIFETNEFGLSTTIDSTGSGFTLEGNMLDIVCDDFTLSQTNSTYLIEPNSVSDNINILIEDDSSFALECYRTVKYEGIVQKSVLLGQITGEKIEIDSLAPTGSINDITFSAPYGDSGLDVGSICVSTSIEDESNYVTEILTLVSSDGLANDIPFGDKNDEENYCLELSNIEGSYNVNQSIMDGAENSTINTSRSYQIVKNQPPFFSLDVPDDVTLNTNQGIIVLVKEEDLSDPEGHTITLSGDTSIDTDKAEGNYTIIAFATDQYGAESRKEIIVELIVQQIPPSVDAGEDLAVDENEAVTLNGTASDTDGQIVSYRWTQLSGVEVQLSDNSSESVNFLAPKVDDQLTLIFQFSVTDDDENTATDSISVVVNNVNVAPTSNAGQNQVVDEDSVVTLSGSGSDSDGVIDSYRWSQISGTTVIIDDSETPSATFTSPTVDETESLVFELAVTDDDSNRAIDSTTIQINDVNETPIADAGQDQSINTGITVQLDGASSYDNDGDLLSYIWTLDSKPFTSTSSLSNATTVTPTIKVDRAGQYGLSLVVNDGKEDSQAAALILTVVEGINPIPSDINLIIVAGGKYHGFSTSSYQEVFQSQTSACRSVGAVDIDSENILYSVGSSRSQGIQAVDPIQPLCIEQGPQPSQMFGVAIDFNGELWGTSSLINTSSDQYTKLYHFQKDGTVLDEVELTGHEDTIFGVDFSSDGTLYGISSSNGQLVTIDQNTGITTFVAELSPFIRTYDIDIDNNDVLRFIDGGEGELYEYELSGTLIRQTYIPSICTSCGFVSVATND
jgi:hypothetical protein